MSPVIDSGDSNCSLSKYPSLYWFLEEYMHKISRIRQTFLALRLDHPCQKSVIVWHTLQTSIVLRTYCKIYITISVFLHLQTLRYTFTIFYCRYKCTDVNFENRYRASCLYQSPLWKINLCKQLDHQLMKYAIRNKIEIIAWKCEHLGRSMYPIYNRPLWFWTLSS